MLTLTDRDLEVCAVLAEQASGWDDGATPTFNILTTGFTQFGSEEVICLYPSRQHYFEALHQKLLKNYHYANRDFDYFTNVLNGRDMILRIVSSSGVFQEDVEDIVQEILKKLWKAHWIERYNPLISSWVHFICHPVKNYIINYLEKSKCKKRYLVDAVLVRSDFASVYSTSQEETPENVYLIKEFLGEWENFLKTQPSFVRGNHIDPAGPPFKRLCTLLPPGSPEIPIESELTLYFLRKGSNMCRVAVPGLYAGGSSLMVNSVALVDYIAMDENTCESLHGIDGNWLIQKYFINPLYLEYRRSLTKSFDYLDFYHYLQSGLAIEEIAVLLNLSCKSVPYWLHKLEKLFRTFWLITDLVPLRMKRLSTESHKCPECSHLNYQNTDVCESCCTGLTGIPGKFRFSLYPWPRVFAKREARDYYEQRVDSVGIKLCAM